MSLQEWLRYVGRRVPWLASELGVSRQAVYQWLDGRSAPRAEHLAKIESMSAGRVTARTFRGTEVSQ